MTTLAEELELRIFGLARILSKRASSLHDHELELYQLATARGVSNKNDTMVYIFMTDDGILPMQK
jgi:hypothetical protein